VDTLPLLPGRYVLIARLEISGSPGWNGSVQSQPVRISVGTNRKASTLLNEGERQCCVPGLK
jgi:hypothetical protein